MRRAVLAALAFALAAAGCAGGDPPAEARAAAFHHNNLGVALMDHGQKEEAEAEFRAALERWPGFVDARVNLAIALHYAGRGEAAVPELRAALDEEPDHVRALFVLGLIEYFQEARYEEAARHFEEVSRQDPADPWTWFYLGLSLAHADRAQDAASALARAADLNPGHQAAHYQLSLALKASGRAGEAAAALDRFKELRARFPATSVPGVGYGEQGPWAEAAPASDPGSRVSFEPVHAPPGAGRPLGLRMRNELIGDLDNDGIEETIVLDGGGVRVEHRAVQPIEVGPGAVPLEGRTVSAWTPPDGTHRVAAAALSDADHDGDLDLYLVRDAAPASLLRNDGKGRFTDIAREAGVEGDRWQGTGVVFGDFDNDRAVDFCVSRRDGSPALFWNRRDGTFEKTTAEGGAAVAIASGDVDQDGHLDLLLTPGAGGTLRILPGRRGRRFAPAIDAGPAGFLQGGDPRCLLHDVDLDGDLDIVCADASAVPLAPRVLESRVREARAHRWLDVEARGLIRPQVLSNFSGIGATLEARAPGLWLRRDVQMATGLAAGPPRGVTFGLGDNGALDYVRAVFPSGVRLTRRGVAAEQALVLEEPAGKYTSCPMIYAWDGRRFAFVNDVLGFASLGEWERPGSWFLPDPDEWLLIEGSMLRPEPPEGGAPPAARIRFVNQLQEISLSDTMRLVAVDHPADVAVHPADPDRSPEQESRPPRVVSVRNLRPPAGIEDEHGHDALEALARVDGVHHDDFDLLPYRGFAARHDLVIRTGRLGSGRPVLLLHGWTEWGGSSSMRAASQAGVGIEPVSLEISEAGGPWNLHSSDIGLPAGLPRSIVVPLPAHLKGAGVLLRLRTNLVIYWDAVLLGEEAGEEAAPRITELPMAGALLRRLGYPQPEASRPASRPSDPLAFDYQRISQEAEWGSIAGAYTRYGDVLPLLGRRDDRFVALDHGDEVALSFDASRLPPLPGGHRRDYLLYLCGYGKDMDINSAHPSTIAPFPFGEMRAYPWGVGEGPDPGLVRDLFEWNTRPPLVGAFPPR